MGGIADYSGSLVMEATIGAGIFVASAPRSDRLVRVYTTEDSSNFDRLVDLHLDDLIASSPLDYPQISRRLLEDPRKAWTALVAGCLSVLMARLGTPVQCGFDIAVSSTVPISSGVSSSGALGVASMLALSTALRVSLDGEEMASLCQEVENHIGHAPCGIMDQITCTLGHYEKLLRLRCDPRTLEGFVDVPPDVQVFGIRSGVRHSVGGSPYGRTRIGAFMGARILEAHGTEVPGGYLCKLTRDDYRRVRETLPKKIDGAQFLSRYGNYPDKATTPDPEQTYFPRGASEHAVYENSRVERFSRLLSSQPLTDKVLENAGRLMYSSHWSYSLRARLGCPETDLLVSLLRQMGPSEGIFGAKIQGGGCGGTVAVLARRGALDIEDRILSPYYQQTGIKAELVTGSSPGALEFGARKVRVE